MVSAFLALLSRSPPLAMLPWSWVPTYPPTCHQTLSERTQAGALPLPEHGLRSCCLRNSCFPR
eukprot:5275153-Prorocentrum_lima.AAC.1